MELLLDIQRVVDIPVTDNEFYLWVKTVLETENHDDTELTIRIVDETESGALNEQYRKKKGPTNVLSFPFEMPEGIELSLLGDLVICAPVVKQEAEEQNKNEKAHWAHMVVHGILHLLGYDHINTADAEIMETKETGILKGLGYADPYR